MSIHASWITALGVMFYILYVTWFCYQAILHNPHVLLLFSLGSRPVGHSSFPHSCYLVEEPLGARCSVRCYCRADSSTSVSSVIFPLPLCSYSLPDQQDCKHVLPTPHLLGSQGLPHLFRGRCQLPESVPSSVIPGKAWGQCSPASAMAEAFHSPFSPAPPPFLSYKVSCIE